MASILKVDTIQDQDGNNIINESANTITIGASGDTITIPSGATFASVGIDDNATSTAITIDSSQKVGIANTIPGSFNSSANQLVVGSGSGQNGITIYSGTSNNGSIHFGDGTGASSYRGSINYYHNGDTLGFNVGASERMRLTSTGVGIGTSSPTYILDVVGGTNTAKFKGRIVNIDGAAASDSPRVNLSLDSTDKAQLLLHRTSDDLQLGTLVNSDSIFITNNTERMRLTSTGLGIGTSSPDDKLHVADSTSAELKLQTDNANNGSAIKFNRSGTDYSYIGTKGYFTGTSDNNLYLRANSGLGIQFYTNGNNQRMLIDSSGNVMTGTTNSAPAQDNVTGVSLRATDPSEFSQSGKQALNLNRAANDGAIVSLRGDGTEVATLQVRSDFGIFQFGSLGTGIGGTSSHAWLPTSGNARVDNTISVGQASYRMTVVYATTGTINTSDQNEKQFIQSLTTAEMNVGKRLSSLIKTYKWNSSVEEKGDNARTHTGIIAQDVQQAFADEGLDATKYGLWCSDTWFVDADGETIEKSEEVSENNLSKTKLGIRYEQLLSFIQAYNDQRFTELEARITALETQP